MRTVCANPAIMQLPQNSGSACTHKEPLQIQFGEGEIALISVIPRPGAGLLAEGEREHPRIDPAITESGARAVDTVMKECLH